MKLQWSDCSYKKFFEQYKDDIEAVTIEKTVYNDEHRYAGRYDFIGKYKGETALFDLKTGATSDFRQLSAYAACVPGIKNLIICPVGVTDNKCGYMKPKICTTPEAEFKEFLKARNKFSQRFGI